MNICKMMDLRRRNLNVDRRSNLYERRNLEEPQSRGSERRHDRHYSYNIVSFFAMLVVLTTFFLSTCIYLFYYTPNRLASTKHGTHFNTERALNDLAELVSIGPKVTGSYENEMAAVKLISGKINEIMKRANEDHSIEYDLQMISGSFNLNVVNFKVNLIYENLQNVVVKIGPKDSDQKSSLLVNCHFDSVPTSPGASDDGLNCAVMLEILRMLSVSNETLPHNVIFLFNGAEENPLLASHGFITQHKWAKSIKAFINLESCGAGGHEVLFQAGPNHPWLIDMYGKAALYPSGLVVAEELFQSGLIPSDTDFRIFRDYGNIPGLDFAHCANGFVYHTRRDNMKSIFDILGVLRHTGENIHSLIKTIIFSTEFNDFTKLAAGNKVYFDVLGLGFIHYDDYVAFYINFVSILFAILAICFTSSRDEFRKMRFDELMLIFKKCTILLGGFLSALAYNILLGMTLDTENKTMSWYSNILIIIPLYGVPTIAFTIASISLSDYIKDATRTKMNHQYLATLLFWTVILFITTIFGLRSAYLFMLLVLPPALYKLFSRFLETREVSLWFYNPVVSFLSAFYFTYISVQTFLVMIPIAGRSGTEKNPEMLIGILTTLLTFSIFSYLCIYFLATSRRWTASIQLMFVHFLVVAAIVFGGLSFPFTVERPQRVFATHVNRHFYSMNNSAVHNDSLYWVQNIERRGRSVLEVLEGAPRLDEFCSKDGYCGLPWFNKFMESSGSTCIPASPNFLDDKTSLELIKSERFENSLRLHFNVTGPDHMIILMTPAPDVKLRAWNLTESVENQKFYFIGYVHGLHSPYWSFWIDLDVKENLKKWNIQLEVSGHYVHHEKLFSTHFSQFITRFPQWAHMTSRLATLKSYQF